MLLTCLGSRGAAPRGEWWLAGGINPSDVIAVYEPLGATGYADSLVNRANPGTYDAEYITGQPFWESWQGWSGNHGCSGLQVGGYVTSGAAYSGIIRSLGTPWQTYALKSAPGNELATRDFAGVRMYYVGGTTGAAGGEGLAQGVLAVTTDGTHEAGYYNGSTEVTDWTEAAIHAETVLRCGPGVDPNWTVTAAVWYATKLTDAQVAAVSAAILEIPATVYVKPTVVWHTGDSQVGTMNTDSYPYRIWSAVGDEVTEWHAADRYGGYGLIGIGNFAAIAETSYLRDTQTLRINTCWGGSNDLSGLTGTVEGVATTVYGYYQAYCAARRAAGWDKLVVFTVMPRNADTDPADYEDRRVAFNALLRGDHSFADALCDVADDARLQDPTDTGYFDAAQVHINDGGQAVVAELLQPIIASWLKL